MDDMDDILNDLLAEDTPRKAPPAKSGRGRPGSGPGQGAAGRGRSASPAPADTMSDVSDADPKQMAKALDDLDDMDAALFGPKKAGGSSGYTPSAASSVPAKPASPSKTPDSGSPVRQQPKKVSAFDVDDYEDPLADILGDNSKKTQKPAGRRKEQELTSPRRDPDRPRTGPGSGSDSSESRRLEIDRPPTRSGTKAQAKQEPSMFDDEDPLDALGFDDSPRRAPPEAVKHKAAKEDGGRGRSIMDDLLGPGSSSAPKATPPGSAGKREFVLDKKYMKQEAKPKEMTEDDFTFGGYMPSAAATPGSRPSSKRSVRFEDDDEDKPAPRGSSAPAGRSRNPASVLEEMMAQDNRDWLEMASSSPAPAKQGEDNRPKSEGSSRKNDSAASEPMDWLGFSSMGSTTPGNQASDDPDDFMQPPSRPRSGGRSGIPKELPAADDWLGSGSPANKTTPKKTEPKQEAADDWLGGGTSSGKDNDWLGLKDSPAARDSDNDDWLGLKSGKESSTVKNGGSDDWLGIKSGPQSPAPKEGKSDDWLGFSDKKDSKSDGPAAGDYMGLGVEIDDPFKPAGSKARADERGLDLFSPPPGKDTSSSAFPWESDNATTRRRGRGRSPQKARPPSPRSASPRGPSPADSPRDLMATLEALKKMEQKKPAGPVKAATTSQTTPSGTEPTMTTGDTAITSNYVTPGTTGYGSSPNNVIDSMAAMYTSPIPSSSGLEEIQRQEMIMRQQQEALRDQQQKQQMEAQRRMVEQQQQAREQMQKMAEQQQMMMKQQMERQMAQISQSAVMAPPMMPSMGLGGSMYGDELFGQVKRLEMEKLHLMNLNETMKSQHQDQNNLLEESHKKRLELVEESWSRREQRLKEENEFLVSQHQSKIQMMEKEKSDQGQAYLRRQEMWEEERRAEIDRLREQQRNDMNSLRQQHEESLDRVRRAKELEVEAVSSQHSTSRSLHDVIDRISENTRGLNELQSQVHIKHNLSLDERENAARAREEQVKALQERLERQHHENEQERARLQGLLAKMEAQLTEQTRSMEEEKWRVRQEESRHVAGQEALEKERMLLMDQIKREREGIQRSKDQLLEEQKSVLAQLYEERRALAQERAAFEMNIKINSEKMQRDSLKNVKTGAELEGSVRILNDEKARLAQQLDDLRSERDSLSRDRSDIEQQRQTMAIEKEKLEKFALQVRQCSKDMEERVMMSDKAADEGTNALMEARRLEGEHAQRLNSIQAQLNTLRTKERQIAQERLSLAKEKQNIEESAKSLLCVNCRTPVRDAVVTTQVQVSNMPQIEAVQVGSRKMTTAASNLLSSLDPDLRAKVESMDSISAQIELDRSIRMWRIAASKDQDFLTEESMFLQAIRHTPYGDNSSKS